MLDQLNTDYKAKYPGFPGGLALKVISKSGEWFVTSGMEPGTTGGIHYRAASVTKTFTATAILLLMQEGKLDLDAKITDTIPGASQTYVPPDGNYNLPFSRQLTIRQLVQNKAGVFDVLNDIIPDTITVSVAVPYKGQNYISYVLATDPNHTFTFDELSGVVSKCRLFYFNPGKGYHYSNTGFSILGKIIERVSGQSYGDYVKDHIFTPMAMVNLILPYRGNDKMLPAPYAKGYLYFPAVSEFTTQNMSANVAEGNLITTPDELAQFALKLFRGEGVLNSYTVNKVMLQPLNPPDTMETYTCGVEYMRNLGYGHGGDCPGYITMYACDPASGFTCVALANAWNLSAGGNNGIIEQVKTVVNESLYRALYIVNMYEKK